MSQYTHVVMHHPNDIILVMSQAGRVTGILHVGTELPD